MSALQHRLSDFLELELHHSLGAYRRTRDELLKLDSSIEEDQRITGKSDAGFLRELTEIMRAYNHALDEGRDSEARLWLPDVSHGAGDPTVRHWCRHPPPEKLPLSRRAAFVDQESSMPDATADNALTWVGAFYEAALYAIDAPVEQTSDDAALRQFQRALLARRADLRESRLDIDEPVDPQHQARRRARYLRRRQHAVHCGIPEGTFAVPGASDVARTDTTLTAVHTIVASHLQAEHHDPLAAFVLRALVDGHLAMHEAESYFSTSLGSLVARSSRENEEVERVLQRSVALNTFVWAVARTAPWVFAQDDDERGYIVNFYGRAWRHNMPMRAMWISAQVSLLALHRRAFARALLNNSRSSYNDYHKLHQHLRETGRRLRFAAAHVDGALEFLDGLDALADHHIGELYRADRDHTSAQRHFGRAFHRLDGLKSTRRQRVIVNSRWFVQLQFSLGKASYELGQHKASLFWYLRTWRSLLDLIAADTRAEVNSDALDPALDWLERIIDEPELHKLDLIGLLRPVVVQIEAFRVDPRFTTLASDVILRLGHLLFVLQVEDADSEGNDESLALRCVRRAWQLDRRSTLALADLLKLHFRATRDGRSASPRLKDAVEAEHGVGGQYPGGSGLMQRMSRAIEYVLLQQLRTTEPTGAEPEETLARELLHSLLTHTDSIEARKSQVHEYLTREPSVTEVPDAGAPALEFICLRRYSSAYPILPRPQDFRADGGGYFIRVHPGDGGGRAFGIAFDPGTSYVDCLYRCGFGIADIDLVVVTHDHVDHASSFEPLLALRHEMRALKANVKPLIVLGNQSVVDRWKRIARYAGDRSLTFYRHDSEKDLEKVSAKVTQRVRALRGGDPPAVDVEVELTGLSSRLSSGEAHDDLSGHPACGLMVSLRAGDSEGSITLTGDLPGIRADLDWPAPWRRAFEADVVVCHMSTAPLAELRQMATLKNPVDATLSSDIAWINEACSRDDFAARFTYAYWLQGADETQVDVVGDEQRLVEWRAPTTHPYVAGLLRIAASFRDAVPEPTVDRILVIGELSEELGSFRRKVAQEVNDTMFGDYRCTALTGDIGLRVVTSLWQGADDAKVRVQCSTCDLDNDLAVTERFHTPREIHEVCVKGENEAIFYNCPEHHPGAQSDDPVFIEKHERYDVFGR